MRKKRGIRLQFAVSLLIILTILSTLTVGLYSSYLVLKGSLEKNYLENNYQYATKLSSSTSDLLFDMKANINALGKIIGAHQLFQEELDEWRTGNRFNSVFVTDPDGVVQIISPKIVMFKKEVKQGTKLESAEIKKALSKKEAYFSEPYRATSGQLILLISTPIFDKDGNYIGLLGGTIYLESDNALKNMLSKHNYEDGSYVYVVDSNGTIIYHPDPSRLNDNVVENTVVSEVIGGENGSKKVSNTQGKDYFAGYAQVKGTGWGIVSQTPTDVINGPLLNLTTKIILYSLPLIGIILVLAWFLTTNLSKPIIRLAQLSENASNKNSSAIPMNKIVTKSTIYEIRQLYYHITNYFDLLNNQIQLDGLTGLPNRKTFDVKISRWVGRKVPFSIILLDIDYFKKVNDTYGHIVGDDVLKHLSLLMKSVTSEEDLCFRYGGEEFGLLLRDVGQAEAFEIAEQLRILVAEQPNPTGKQITISLGITSLSEDDSHPKEIIQRADTALYESKANGRNQTSIYTETSNQLVVK